MVTKRPQQWSREYGAFADAFPCNDPSSAQFSIVISAFNEEKQVGQVLEVFRLIYPLSEIILVDNNSKDKTNAVASGVDGVVVTIENRAGKGNAMIHGLHKASRDYVIFHDADLEYDPLDVYQIMQAQLAHPGCMICGTRQVSMGQPPWESIGAATWIRWLLQIRFGGVEGVDILSGTRSASTNVWKAMGLSSPHFSIETETVKKARQQNIPIVNVPVAYSPRTMLEGKKIRPIDIFKLMREALF